MAVVAAPAHDIQRTSPELAATVGAGELESLLVLLRGLADSDWSKPTDCLGWTVRDLVAHVAGQFEGAASLRVFLRRHRVGHRRYPDRTRLAAFTQQQVDDLGQLPPAELIDLLARVGPKALRKARRTPALLRRLNGSRLFPEDPVPDPRLGYFLDVIGPRDAWMHRVDLARATGRPMAHGEHEREIVTQVIRDLGLAWTGPSLILELTGPPGGCWTLGSGSPVATVRAETVAYLRTLSGRDDEPALEIDGDPAVSQALAVARVVF